MTSSPVTERTTSGPVTKMRTEDHDVREGGTISSATGGRAEHDGDLRHLAGDSGHRSENAADGIETQYALAQSCAAGVPDTHDRCGVREGTVIGGDDGTTAVIAHGAALHGDVGGEGHDLRAVRATHCREHTAVILGGNGLEDSIVEEVRESCAGRAGVELGGL